MSTSRRWLALPAAALLGGGGLVRAGAEVEPAEPQVSFHLDQARGKPGDVVTLSLSITTDTPLKSVSVAINFDESILRIDSADRVLDAAMPLPAEDVSNTRVDNRNETGGDQSTEGWIYLTLEASESSGDLKWPTGKSIPVYKLNFRILRGAPPGFSPVVFDSVGPIKMLDEDVLLENSAAASGDTAPVAARAPADLVNGGVIIEIIGEVGFFLRADTTMDRSRDISDPISTLGFLFHGTVGLPCADAADANDDGKIDVSDAVFTLFWLYSTGTPPPFPDPWGPDPTEDKLCCEETGGCP